MSLCTKATNTSSEMLFRAQLPGNFAKESQNSEGMINDVPWLVLQKHRRHDTTHQSPAFQITTMQQKTQLKNFITM